MMKTRLTRTMACILVAGMTMGTAVNAFPNMLQAQTTMQTTQAATTKAVTVGNFSYTILPNAETKTCTINNIVISQETSELIIPETIDGMTVTKIMGTKKANDSNRNVFGLRSEYNTDVYDNEADWGLYAPVPDEKTSNEEDDLKSDALTKIVLPDTVEEIGEFAFAGLENLQEIKMPKQLKQVGIYAFIACPSLTSINIPEGWTKGVQKITYGRKWKSFSVDKNNKAYKVKKGLLLSRDGKILYAPVADDSKTLKIPNGVEKIGSNQYVERKWRGKLLMPVKVKCGYERYNKIVLPASLKNVAGQIFTMDKNCEIIVSDKNKTLAKQKNCIYNKKTGRLLVAKVNKKGVLKISSKVKVLGAKTSVIGGGVKKVIVPKTVKKLKKDCFVYPLDGNNISIYLKGKKPPKGEVSVFRGVTGNVYVPKISKKVYKKWMQKTCATVGYKDLLASY